MLLTTALFSTILLGAATNDSCSTAKTVAFVPGQKSIVETAVGNESFSTLVAALKAADLVDALQAKGPFTVFAPTNEAFAKLPDKQLAMLLDPENKA
jgi:uncharacterized surface protein with fasciclin (FAS1) repeats